MYDARVGDGAGAAEELELAGDHEGLGTCHVDVPLELAGDPLRPEQEEVERVPGQHRKHCQRGGSGAERVAEPLPEPGSEDDREGDQRWDGHHHGDGQHLRAGEELGGGRQPEEASDQPGSAPLAHKDLVQEEHEQGWEDGHEDLGVHGDLAGQEWAELVEQSSDGGRDPPSRVPAHRQEGAPARQPHAEQGQDVVGDDRAPEDGDRRQHQRREEDRRVPHQVDAGRVVEKGGEQGVEVVAQGERNPLQGPDGERGVPGGPDDAVVAGEEPRAQRRQRHGEVEERCQHARSGRRRPPSAGGLSGVAG